MRLWWAAAVAVLVVAALLRFHDLELRPVHHDEGVNGFFLTKLVRNGEYRYDPNNYHGPTLYYLAAAAVQVLGLETTTVRSVTSLAGLLTVALILSFHPWIGRWGAIAAAALLAVSPGAVFFSRYFIHETLVALFTLGVAAAVLRVRGSADPRPVLLASVSGALLFATKETAVVHAGVLVLAGVLAHWLGGGGWPDWARLRHPDKRELRLATAALGAFAVINLLLYSSFFTYPQGVWGAFRSLAVWSRTGATAHLSPWNQHIVWLWEAERALMLLAACGGAIALWRRTRKATVFICLWTLGLLAAYSLVRYKTPWLGLNVVVPASLLAGHALGALGEAGGRLRNRLSLGPWARATTLALALALTLGAVAYGARQTVALNLQRYDDESHPFVYAHTRRGFLDLVERIERYAEASGEGKDLAVTVASPDHWPLAWYLRDYERVGYWGRIPDSIDALVVVGSLQQEAELRSALGSDYELLEPESPASESPPGFPLRPGVTLVLFARSEVLAPAP